MRVGQDQDLHQTEGRLCFDCTRNESALLATQVARNAIVVGMKIKTDENKMR